MEPARPAKIPEIDWLKGFAILCVVGIHAKVYELSFVHQYVVNRAVPIFLVLLGVTSELFFQKREAEAPRKRLVEWYQSRVFRLIPSTWALAIAWLSVVFYFGRARDLHIGLKEALLTLFGWAPWIGTAWFITLVLQLVVLFPAIRWVCVKLGPYVVLPVSAVVCGYCVWITWDIVAIGTELFGKVAPPGWFYLWVFVPRVVFHLSAGVYLARYSGGRPGTFLWLGCAAVWAGTTALFIALPRDPMEMFTGPMRGMIVAYLLDVPLAIALLGFFGVFARWERAHPLRFLALCGRASWGIYLGHLFVHEFIHLGFIAPETGPETVRMIYAALLFVLGLGLALLGGLLRRAARPRALV